MKTMSYIFISNLDNIQMFLQLVPPLLNMIFVDNSGMLRTILHYFAKYNHEPRWVFPQYHTKTFAICCINVPVFTWLIIGNQFVLLL